MTVEIEPERSDHTPVFNVPAVVLLFSGILVAIHGIRTWYLSDQANFDIILAFSFIPARLDDAALSELWPLANIWSPLSYSFLHGDWTHLFLNLFWLAAFGSVVARRTGTVRFVLLCMIGSIAGAVFHLATHISELAPIIGASAVVSACVGAAVRFAFTGNQGIGMNTTTHNAPLTIAQTFSNSRTLIFVAVWLGLNLVFGVGIVPVTGAEAGIAWEAHIGGLLAGLFLFGLFDRPRAQY